LPDQGVSSFGSELNGRLCRHLGFAPDPPPRTVGARAWFSPASQAAPKHQFHKIFRASRLRLSGASHARLPVLGCGSSAKPKVAADSRAHFTLGQIMVLIPLDLTWSRYVVDFTPSDFKVDRMSMRVGSNMKFGSCPSLRSSDCPILTSPSSACMLVNAHVASVDESPLGILTGSEDTPWSQPRMKRHAFSVRQLTGFPSRMWGASLRRRT